MEAALWGTAIMRALRATLGLLACLTAGLPALGQQWMPSTSIPVPAAHIQQVSTGDLDGDGFNDMAVATESGIWTVASNGAGGWGSPNKAMEGATSALALGRWTHTKSVDMIAVGTPAGRGTGLYLLSGLGKGQFADPVEVVVPGLKIAEMCHMAVNADAGGKRSGAVYLNCPSASSLVVVGTYDEANKNFVFTSLKLPLVAGHVTGIAVGDFNQDGLDDLSVSSVDESSSVRASIFWGTEGGLVADHSARMPESGVVAVGDVDGDRASDVLLLSGQTIQEFRGVTGSRSPSGAGSFAVSQDCAVHVIATGVLQLTRVTRGILAKDVVLGESCLGASGVEYSQLQVVENQQATDLKVVPRSTVSGSLMKYRFDLSLTSLHPASGLAGSVLIAIDNDAPEPLTIVDGAGVLERLLPARRHVIRAVYRGDDSHASASATIVVSANQAPAEQAMLERRRRSVPTVYFPSRQPALKLVSLMRPRLRNMHMQAAYSPGPSVTGSPSDTLNFEAQSNYGEAGTYVCDDGSGGNATCQGGHVAPNGRVQWILDGVTDSGHDTLVDNQTECNQDNHGEITYCDNYYIDSTYSATNLSDGTHTLVATIPTDQDASAAFTDTWNIQISGGKTTPTVSASASQTTTTYGQGWTGNVHVSCNSACGQVDYRIDNGDWGTVNLDSNGNFSAGRGGDLSAGSHTFSVNYLGNDSYNTASSNVVNLTVNKASAGVSVSCSPNPMAYSRTNITTCVGSASGSGTVTYTENGNGFGAANQPNGYKASGFNTATPRNYTVHFVYNGDSNYASGSADTTFTVVKASPGVSISMPSHVASGATWQASVNVGCNYACGQVDYRLDGNDWGTVNLDGNGNYSASHPGDMGAGTHTLQVNYFGDGNNNTASSSVQFTIDPPQAVPSLSVQCSPSSLPYQHNLVADPGFELQPMTPASNPNQTMFISSPWLHEGGDMIGTDSGDKYARSGQTNAWLATNGASGWDGLAQDVSVQPNTNYLWTAWVQTGYTSNIGTMGARSPSGTELGTATQFGNDGPYTQVSFQFNSGSNSTVRLYIGFQDPGSTTWMRVDDAALVPASSAFSCTASQSGGTGTLSWTLNGNYWIPPTEVNGSAIGMSAANDPGTYTVGVTYSGDSSFSGTSAQTSVTITKASPTVSITASPKTASYNQQESVSGVVSCGYNCGQVSLLVDGQNWIQVSPDATGHFSATRSTWDLTGSHTVVAQYAGDTDNDSASGNGNWTVSAPASPSLTLSCLPAQVRYMDPYTCTATLGNQATGGIAWVTSDSGAHGTSAVSGGTATFHGTATQTGTIGIVANYGGDTNNGPIQVSANLPVDKAPLAITITANPNPAIYGDEVTYTFSFAGTGAPPTGKAQITKAGNVLGNVTLDGNGIAVFKTSTLGAGTHTLTATYLGDDNYQ